MARKKKTVELDREKDIAPGLVAKTKKRLVVARGSSHPALATDVAAQLGTELVPTEYRTFASGEILTRFEVSIRGCDFFLIQSFGPPVNEWLMETLIMLDAAKRASAKRITVVAPYYPYSRQDKKGRGREPITSRSTTSTCVGVMTISSTTASVRASTSATDGASPSRSSGTGAASRWVGFGRPTGPRGRSDLSICGG